VYCQNAPLSRGEVGKAVTVERLAQIFLELQRQGAHNINLVTPTHYVPQIIAALDRARAMGLRLPIVYNTSGYETVATIEALAGFVDVYLTDFKYAAPQLAVRYSNAPDYPAVALAALQAMYAQVGDYTLAPSTPSFSRLTRESNHTAAAPCDATTPLLQRGVIVRHLMVPGEVGDSKAVVRTVFSVAKNAICLSIMNQYTPMAGVDFTRFPKLRRTVSEDEYSELIDYALALGVTNSFMQEGGTAEASFIPPFDLTGV